MKKKIKTNSLYIHIPFCKNICPYCDFIKFIKNDEFIKKYLIELNKDLDVAISSFKKFKTIYIGGGTPSILSYEDLTKLLKKLQRVRRFNTEFTIECNPEDITIEKLKLFKKYHINRISLGIQSFNKEILKEIKRDYSIDYFSLINLIKKYIKNINVDFIYGFKDQTLDDLKEDLTNFIKLDVNHVSIYSLIVDENTIFFKKGYKEQNEDDSRLFYDFIVSFLRKHGYERYEVSNFAKNKKYSKHNLNYWKNNTYLGIGLGAHGYINNNRYQNTNSLNLYLNGKNQIIKEDVDQKLLKEYFFITNLRLEKGFNIKKYNKLFNSNFLKDYKNEIKELTKEGYLIIKNGRCYASDEGIAILDRIILKFFK